MTNKPKFKTLWTNTKKGDTSNDLIIHKYRGTPLQLIDLNGQQVLVIQYENTLEFLDPYTFTPVDSPFKIAAKKTAVYRHTGGLIKVASEWCMLCVREDSKNHYQIVICNLASKQTSILKETSTWINEILVVDIAEQQYAFVTYKTSPTIRVKYNLQTQKEELQIKLPIELSDDLHFMEHLGTQYPNDTIIDAQTGEQIGVEKNIKILKVNNQYLMAAITNNNQLDILDANVPSAPKLIHSILIDNDGDWSLIAHKSKLIAASFNKTKVYDLEHHEQDPVVCFWDDGTLVGSGRNLYPIDYQGASFVIQAEIESACFSLDTGKERTDIKHVSIVGNLLPFTDKQNRALFIARCGESFGDQYTVLFNPKGHIRSEDEYEYHYHAVTTTIEDTEVCITHTNKRINIYHLQTGAMIKSVSIAHSKDIKQLQVTEIGHKPILLALCNKEIKAYTLPDIEDTMILFPIADAFHMDIIEMEGKRQLMATNTEIFRWDLETGTPICNPKFVFDEGSKEHNEGY